MLGSSSFVILFYVFFKVENLRFLHFVCYRRSRALPYTCTPTLTRSSDFCSKIDGLLSLLICADFRHNRRKKMIKRHLKVPLFCKKMPRNAVACHRIFRYCILILILILILRRQQAAEAPDGERADKNKKDASLKRKASFVLKITAVSYDARCARSDEFASQT